MNFINLKTSILIVLILAINFAFAQKQITTESGLKYTITKTNEKGLSPKVGDKVSVHYVGKLLNDTVFDSSVARGTPFDFELGLGRVIKGWDEGVAYLKKGEKATLVIPANLAYGERATGKIPANSTLIFDVELVDIVPQKVIEPYLTEGKDTITTASGLQYIIVQKGKGKAPKQGSMVKVDYTGYLLDGKIFDSSIKRNQPIEFELGVGQVIKGWDEGLLLMSAGTKLRLIIPYTLAYGEAGRPPQIPAKSTLIFDVELRSFKEPIKVEQYDVKGKDTLTTASGLKYIIVQKGRGLQAMKSAKVKVHYSGYLLDGTMFDSSMKRSKPIEFTLGVGQVIKGWDEGIQLMAIGDKLRLIVPYGLAYGEAGHPPVIPAKATLVFDVELVSVTAAE